MNGYVVLGSAIVGLLVGLTGAGGGALMTPMLVLVFSAKPSAAISSDLVAAVAMRPLGAAVHLRRGTVDTRMVGLLSVGSVPAAFAGSFLLHLIGHTETASATVQKGLGAALLLGAAAMAVRHVMDRRASTLRTATPGGVPPRALPTVAVGMAGGLVVGLTSVGAGSLMIVMLMWVYPSLSARSLVGTDLAQSVPLAAAAACGALVFGTVRFPLTGAVVLGGVPAVLVGSWLSARAPERWLRPAIFCVVLVSGLKCAGVGNTALAAVIGASTVVTLAIARRGERRPPADMPEPESAEDPVPARS